MTYSRKRALTIQLLMSHPLCLTYEQAVDMLAYARRTLPTIANIQGFKPGEAVQIGDWQGCVNGNELTRKDARRLAMPLRYADAKLHMAALLKMELVLATQIARAHAANDDLSWEELVQFYPKRSVAKKQLELLVNDSSVLATNHVNLVKATGIANAQVVQASTPTKVKSMSPASSSSESDSNSSATDSSSDSSADPICADEDQIEWQLSKGKKGHLHIVDTDNPECTLCGRHLAQPEIGKGMTNAMATGHQWSPRCLSKLHPEVYQKWFASPALSELEDDVVADD